MSLHFIEAFDSDLTNDIDDKDDIAWRRLDPSLPF